MNVIIPTIKPKRALELKAAMAYNASRNHNYEVVDNSTINKGPVGSLVYGAGLITDSAEWTLFIHDDVEVMGPWDPYFDCLAAMRPHAGVAGFHGATGYGVSDIYRHPYQLVDLARQDPVSNMRDAELHGRRSAVPCRVAVVDGLAMAFSPAALRVALKEWGAPGRPPHHQYDNDACLACTEAGYEVWMLPVAAHHHGGLTACSGEYAEWLKVNGWSSDSEVHAAVHPYTYSRFRRLLPLRVN